MLTSEDGPCNERVKEILFCLFYQCSEPRLSSLKDGYPVYLQTNPQVDNRNVKQSIPGSTMLYLHLLTDVSMMVVVLLEIGYQLPWWSKAQSFVSSLMCGLH